MRQFLSLGVDLGGTKTEVALVKRFLSDSAGPSGPSSAPERYEVLLRRRVPTPGNRGYDAVLGNVVELVTTVARELGVPTAALPTGVGMPGATTRREGFVKNSNTTCLNGRPFREDLSRALGRAVQFDNDANCFALAEARLGAGRAHQNGIVFGVILGTGVGGGIVIDGKAWPGLQGLGGEWGHHPVGPWRKQDGELATETRDIGLGISERPPCFCGKMGCLELYASGPAIERDYLRRSGRAERLPEIYARRASDPHAAAAIDEMLEAFGRGVATLIDFLDPNAIILGGGVSNLDCLYGEGVERVARYVLNDELLTPILKHELGDSAGVLGAALLAE
jgi:fructokinase